MRFLRSLFGKRNSGDSKNEFLDLESTIHRLASQQREAAARGERIVNRFPPSVQRNRLKTAILAALRQLDYEQHGISEELAKKIEGVDLKGPLGEIGTTFDALQSALPKSLLQEIEAEVRAAKTDYDDIETLAP